MTPVVFEVIGTPQPQGSTRAFMRKGARFPIVTSDNPKLKGWRRDVSDAAARAYRGPVWSGPVRVVIAAYLPRPQSLRGHTTPHVKKPDADKICRGVLDSLTGILYRDDSQVSQVKCTKQYAGVGESPRAVIAVTPLIEEGRLL